MKALHDREDPLVRKKLLEDPLKKVVCPKWPGGYKPVRHCAYVDRPQQGYDEQRGRPCPHLVGFVDMDRGKGAPMDIRPFCGHPHPLRVHTLG